MRSSNASGAGSKDRIRRSSKESSSGILLLQFLPQPLACRPGEPPDRDRRDAKDPSRVLRGEPVELDQDQGGALADGRGRVVGINTAVAGVGLGLAVPINGATRRIIAALMTEGRFRRAYLGIAGGPRPLPPRLARELGQESGVEIVQVIEDSPAANAGLRPEDLIVSVDNSQITGVDQLHKLMINDAIGRTVRIGLIRSGRRIDVELVPAELEG